MKLRNVCLFLSPHIINPEQSDRNKTCAKHLRTSSLVFFLNKTEAMRLKIQCSTISLVHLRDKDEKAMRDLTLAISKVRES